MASRTAGSVSLGERGAQLIGDRLGRALAQHVLDRREAALAGSGCCSWSRPSAALIAPRSRLLTVILSSSRERASPSCSPVSDGRQVKGSAALLAR